MNQMRLMRLMDLNIPSTLRHYTGEIPVAAMAKDSSQEKA
jgi:hypothetical protein